MTRPLRIAHVATVDLTVRFLLLNQLIALRDAGFEVSAISSPGPWVKDIEDEGITHIPWRNATRTWDLGADLRAYKELVGILRSHCFDLVHVHNPKPGVIGRIAARRAGVPCVVNTVHGYFTTPDDRVRRKLPVLGAEWVAARFSDLELFQSEEDLSWARRLRVVGRDKSLLLGNGADLARFRPSSEKARRVKTLRADLGIPKDSVVVGTVGRVVAEKGYREFLAAARSVRTRYPNAVFVAAGSIDADKADALGEDELDRAQNDVVFTGWREDVDDLVGMFDIFVLASWREGMPRSAIEAAAAEVPLVLTNIRGCREIVRDGEEGLLVPAGDADLLTAAITRLVADENLRRAMGRAARTRAERLFDENRVTEIIVRESRELLMKKGLLEKPTPSETRVRPARPDDAAAIAQLHRNALPGAFLPSLGPGFLARLYRALGSDDGAVALVAENGAGVVGFAAGVVSIRSFYRRFYRKHGLASAISALPYLVRPAVLRSAMETARYPSDTDDLPDSELLSIAVDDGYRAQGVGRLLAAEVLRCLASKGVADLKVVVGADNDGANLFYERLGFSFSKSIEVHNGAASNVWVTKCRSQ